jgi:hypothetical protein
MSGVTRRVFSKSLGGHGRQDAQASDGRASEGPHQRTPWSASAKQSAPCSVKENTASEIEVNGLAKKIKRELKSGILHSKTKILFMCLEYLKNEKCTSNFAMLF